MVQLFYYSRKANAAFVAEEYDQAVDVSINYLMRSYTADSECLWTHEL